MKSIILFRHGKSDWNANYDGDHNRPLAKRGIKATKNMGRFLAERNQIPDLVISSTAVRARTTAELAMEAGNWNCQMELESAIYGGSPDTLLNLTQQQDNTLVSICLVGHEPNFSMFISRASNDGYIRFTTANMAKIDFQVNQWKDIRFYEGKLDWLQRPKELE
tara:strand:+ start:345 stop:836 length:492 start_codon:yes stop_codon:yes gene_type:complete